jgi:hypothetical protein
MTTGPSQKPSLQPKAHKNFDAPMTDDSETIAMRVTVIGGEPNADHHCPDEPKRKPRVGAFSR